MGTKKKQLLKLLHFGSDKQIKFLDKMSALKNPFGFFHNIVEFAKEFNIFLFMKF
jgi:hypothetical protein